MHPFGDHDAVVALLKPRLQFGRRVQVQIVVVILANHGQRDRVPHARLKARREREVVALQRGLHDVEGKGEEVRTWRPHAIVVSKREPVEDVYGPTLDHPPRPGMDVCPFLPRFVATKRNAIPPPPMTHVHGVVAALMRRIEHVRPLAGHGEPIAIVAEEEPV